MDRARNGHITPFDLVLVLVSCVSACSVIALTLNAFNPIRSVILGVLLTLAFLKIFGLRIASSNSFGVGIASILLVGLLFRAEPYEHLIGGWDAGIYVNMSSYYGEKGSTFITDNVRKSLTNAQKQLYDEFNHYLIRNPVPSGFLGKYEGIHHPGVYIRNLKKSKYVFQFYPLHPIWMAIFSKFLGAEHGVYSLVFFSLISIVGLYLIALEVCEGERFAGYLVAFFVAINPAHAYFSKYPVADIIVLTFSSTSFYYLIKYYKESLKGRTYPHYLFLSAGLISCLFFTKIIGFMYVPFYYALLLMTILFAEQGDMRRHLLRYFVAVFILFGISVLYGMRFSFPYSSDVYMQSFPKLFGYRWRNPIILLMFSLMLLAFCLAFLRDGKTYKRLQNTVLFLKGNLNYVLYIVMLLGMYKAYQLAFTDKYVGSPSKFWSVPYRGWGAITYSNMFLVISYMSPFAFVVFLPAIYHCKKRNDAVLNALLLFLASFWMYGTVIRIATPIQYEWIRYLLSELVPYSILMVCIYLGYMWRQNMLPRFLIYIIGLLIAIYPLYFTTLYSCNEAASSPGPNECLKTIAGHMNENDLLLLSNQKEFQPGTNAHFDDEIITPLSYYYHLNVFDIGDASNVKTRPMEELILGGKYNDIFLLSTKRIPADFLIPVDDLSYTFGKSADSHTFPPTRFVYSKRDLFLHKIDKSDLLREFLELHRVLFLSYCKDNLVNFHQNSFWTDGDSSIKDIGYTIKDGDTFLVVNTAGWTRLNDKELNLKLYGNGEELEFCYRRGNSFYFKLPKKGELTDIRITSSTFVPKELGMNDDSRQLGVYVRSISIE